MRTFNDVVQKIALTECRIFNKMIKIQEKCFYWGKMTSSEGSVRIFGQRFLSWHLTSESLLYFDVQDLMTRREVVTVSVPRQKSKIFIFKRKTKKKKLGSLKSTVNSYINDPSSEWKFPLVLRYTRINFFRFWIRSKEGSSHDLLENSSWPLYRHYR